MSDKGSESKTSVLGKRSIECTSSEPNVNEPTRKKPKTEASAKLDVNKCSVWLPKKRRQCKHDLIPNTKYCRFHLPSDQSSNIKRTECKYCKTLIYKTQNITKHYQRCPVKRQMDHIQNQSFYQKNIHFYGDYHSNNEEKQSPINSEQFIPKLKEIYASLTLTKVTDESQNSSFEAIRDVFFKVHKQKQNLKHCSQIESIIANMDKQCDLNKDIPILLELGGGKASFGAMLHYYYKEESKLIIIDINSNFRNKEDNRLENVDNICRVQCGLEHCKISTIKHIEKEVSNDTKQRIFVMSKHLCGAATDFGLRCVVNDCNIKGLKIGIIAIALCCRGKCSLETYCNVKYFESIGFEANEFELIRKMASWEVDGNESDSDHLEIGTMCRRLIDEGRVQFLKQHGFTNIKLIKYVERDVTKENILMLACSS